MSDLFSKIHASDNPREPAHPDANANASSPPKFGLVDVIEAFTAMRHESRVQTRENRELAESIQAAAANIHQLDSKLTEHLSVATQDNVARDLAELIVELDTHLTRAVDATVNYDATEPPLRHDALTTVRREFDNLDFVSRWFCRRFLTNTLRALDADTEPIQQENPATKGLTLVVARLRRMMKQQLIERIETVGMPFDAETMNAIAAIPSDSQPGGHVVDELSPAYSWRGTILRYAEVRVAT